MTTDEKKKAHKQGLDRAVRKVREQLNKTLKAVRTIHHSALTCYHAGEFDGGKMRNLDDAECWLADARDALTDYLKAL